MNSNIASSKALGFGVFAVGTWMFFLAHAGLVHPMGVDPGTMQMAMTLAALGLLIAGIMAFIRHEGWLAFFFLFWAGLAWGSSHGTGHGAMPAGDMRFTAWFTIAITLVNLYLWYVAMKSKKLGGAINLTMLLLWLAMLALGLQGFLGANVLERVSGALGLASSLAAFYVSAGAIAKECCPQMTLPGIARNDSGL